MQIQSPFIWGSKGRKLTPEQVERERERADAMLMGVGDTSPVGHWLQGAGRVVNAITGKVQDRRAAASEELGYKSADEYIANDPVLAGLIGPPASDGATIGTPANIEGTPFIPAGEQVGGADGIRAGLVERGLPEHVADAFILNFQDESGLNPGINEAAPIVPGSRGGFGLAQWTGPRRKALEAFAAQRGTPVSDTNTQLDFLMTELQGPEAGAAESILSAPDTGTAAAAIVNKFLRPAEEHRARRVANYMGGAAAPTGGMTDPQRQSPGVVSALAGAMGDPWVAKKYGPVIQALMGQQMRRGDMDYQQQLAQSDPMYQAKLAQMTQPEAVDPWAGTQVINGQVVRMGANGPEVIGDFNTPDPGYQQVTPEEAAAMGLPPGAYQRSADGKISQIGAPATAITLDMNGNPRPELLGTQGLVAIPDPNSPQGYRVEPAPGSPLAVEREQAEQKAKESDRQSGIKMGTTLENLALNIEELENGGIPVTGPIGAIARNIPGTAAADFSNRTTQINTRAALDEVQNMRDNSPTGGAVGQLTDSEREAIGLAATSLSNSTSKDEYLRAAKKFRELMLDTAHGAGNWSIDENGQLVLGDSAGGGSSQGEIDFESDTPPEGLSPEDKDLWQYGTPEERRAVWGR